MTPTVPGLHAPVVLRRSEEQVPLIEARGLLDAWAGLGYAVALDRTFQLDLLRRNASGRLSELFGASCVERDSAQRREGFTAAADRALGELPKAQAALLHAYTAGINAALADAPVPLEHGILGATVEPWRPRDSLLIALLLGQMLSGDGEVHRMRATMRRRLPAEVVDFLLTEADPYLVGLDGAPAAPRAVEPPTEALHARFAQAREAGPAVGAHRQIVASQDRPWGSNAVVLAGRHTADGRALLANDMHLPLDAPALFHRSGLRWPDGRVDGVTVPGLPVFVAAVTDTLAWGATRLAADAVELVQVEPRELTTRIELIRVRGGQPVRIEVRESRWGPVHGRCAEGRPLARHWVGRDPGALDLGLADLLEAADAAAGADAARAAGGAQLNILLADRAGRIAWTVSGRFPARRPQDRPDDRAGVAPDRAWTGHRPPCELPVSIDPPDGYLISANNGTPEHRAASGLGDNHFSSRRAARIGELVRAADGRPWTEARLLELQADLDAGFYTFYRDLALRTLTDTAVAARDRDARRGLRDAIRAWDGTARTDALGLPVLVAWRELLRESLFAALLRRCAQGDESFVYCWHSHEAPLRALLDDPRAVPPPHRDQSAFLLFELDICAALLARLAPEIGVHALRWGRLNPSGIRHPLSAPLAEAAPELARLLDLPQDEMPGCPESVCAARPGFGPALRLAGSPGRTGQALINLPGGQHGDPRSPHYRDQFPIWLAAAPAPLAPPPARPDRPLVLEPAGAARATDGSPEPSGVQA